MNAIHDFWFAIEPIPKARPRMTRKGRAYTPAKTRNFEAEIAKQAKLQFFGGPNSKPLKVTMTFYVTRPKSVRRPFPMVKPDIDNLAKSVLDGMEGVIFVNDSQIIDLRLRKYYADKTPGIEVKVEPLE